MQTKILNFVDYEQCGQILKPPPGNYQYQYILQCFQCQKIYLLFEAFMFHIEDDCKGFEADEESQPNGSEPNITKVHTEDENMELCDNNAKKLNVEDGDENYISIEKENLLIAGTSDLDLSSIDTNLSSTLDNGDEYKLSDVDDLFDANSVVILDNSDEEYNQSTDEEIESISDDLNGEEDKVYKIKKRAERNDDLELSDFILKFFDTKEYVIDFIEAYKKQPCLWSKNYPYLKTKVGRENRFQQIANAFNEKHAFSISRIQAKYIIAHLCRKYREDIKCINEMEESKISYTPSWFFENLSFLKPFIENNEKLETHMVDLTPTQIKELIEIYKDLPHLWNTQIVEHYCRNKIEAAQQDMMLALETKLGIKITENTLERFIRTIRECFRRIKLKEFGNKSNEDNDGVYDNMLDNYFDCMNFLNDHVGRFECSECKRSFNNSMYLKIHQNNVHGFTLPCCSQCKKPFKSIVTYKNHAKLHMGDLRHVCTECGKKFIHSKELQIHMRNHNGAKPFCCEICGATFRHIQSLTIHHRRHVKKYLHTCGTCGRGFYTKGRYRDHMSSHSNTRNEVCDVCGKAFITKRSLQQHVVIHDDVRKYSCKLCDKSFKQNSGLNQHMRTHGVVNSKEKTTTENE